MLARLLLQRSVSVWIYLRVAVAEAPHSPNTHHAGTQGAHCHIDVRLVLHHDEETCRHHTETSHDQPVPVRFHLHDVCSCCSALRE